MRTDGATRDMRDFLHGFVPLALCTALACTVGLQEAGESAAAPPGDATERPQEKILHVAADGSAPFRTIQAAIDAAPAEAVIRIAPGTYDEPLEIQRPVTLEGAGWKETKLMYHWFGFGELGKPDFPVPPQSRERFEDLLKRVKTTDGDAHAEAFAALIKEFGPRRTLTISNVRGVSLRGVQVSMSGKVSAAGLMSAPMLLVENSGVAIVDCAFAGSPVEGIQVKGASEATFHRSLIAGIRGSGFVIDSSSKARVRISDCEIRHCGYAGAQIKGAGEVIVENCRISGIEFHGIRYDDASPTLTGNAFFNINRGGIYADGKTRATVRENLFLGCAIAAGGRNRDVIERNTFVYLRPRPNGAWTNEAAVTISGGAEPTVRRNVFSRYEHGVSQPPGKVPGAAIADNVFDTTGSPVVRWRAEKNPPARYEDEPLPPRNTAGSITLRDPERDDFRLAVEQAFADRDVGARHFAAPQNAWPEIAEERELLDRLAGK